jgi:hypothetical protein
MLKNAWDLSYLNIKGLGHIMAILHSRGDRGCPIRSGRAIIWHFVEPKKRRETRGSQLSTCLSQCCLWLLPVWLGSDRSDCLYNLQGPILHGHHDSLASRDMGLHQSGDGSKLATKTMASIVNICGSLGPERWPVPITGCPGHAKKHTQATVQTPSGSASNESTATKKVVNADNKTRAMWIHINSF